MLLVRVALLTGVAHVLPMCMRICTCVISAMVFAPFLFHLFIWLSAAPLLYSRSSFSCKVGRLATYLLCQDI
ncbi:hypothetical protein BKA81DRAFT_369531 [Phyllosticta paracitricarpa]